MHILRPVTTGFLVSVSLSLSVCAVSAFFPRLIGGWSMPNKTCGGKSVTVGEGHQPRKKSNCHELEPFTMTFLEPGLICLCYETSWSKPERSSHPNCTWWELQGQRGILHLLWTIPKLTIGSSFSSTYCYSSRINFAPKNGCRNEIFSHSPDPIRKRERAEYRALRDCSLDNLLSSCSGAIQTARGETSEWWPANQRPVCLLFISADLYHSQSSRGSLFDMSGAVNEAAKTYEPLRLMNTQSNH